MEPVVIGVLIGAGSLVTSAASFAVNAYFRARNEQRKADDEVIAKAQDQFSIVCSNNQRAIWDQLDERERHIYARCEKMEADHHEQAMVVATDIGEMKGLLKSLDRAMNGGLEARISRAVMAAIGGERQ